MDPLPDQLAQLDALAEIMLDAHGLGDDLRRVDDDGLMVMLAAAARVQRRLEAVQIDIVGEIGSRSSGGVVDERMTSRYGCHDLGELVQRTTLVGPQTAGRLVRASKAVCAPRALISGELLEPALPGMRTAMLRGAVGVDGVLAVANPLLATGSRASRTALRDADELLAAAAMGEGADAAPPACADLLRIQAQAWQVALDQDGAEPRDRLLAHRRGVTLGRPTDAGVPVRGMLMPEVAAQFQRLCDSMLSPRVAPVRFIDDSSAVDHPDAPVDLRTRAQKQHDVLATALTVAAASGELPTIGGAAPTLVVSAREEDLARGAGHAHLDDFGSPVSIAAAQHIACGAVIQRVVLGDDGRILRLGTEERVFNRHQRRAIALRDGGCIIPGCGVRAAWCEIHHVVDHARGGPTHTDNGVLLCWHHHRFLERSGWRIRMNRGVPEVMAPIWWDSSGRWRPVTTSPTRLHDAVARI